MAAGLGVSVEQDSFDLEHRRMFKSQIRAQWLGLKATADEATKAEISRLIDSEEDLSWLQINHLQLLLLSLLPPAAVKAKYAADVERAIAYGTTGEGERALMTAALATNDNDTIKCSYRAFLEHQQRNYISNRYRRSNRVKTAWHLLSLFLVIALIGACPILVFGHAPAGTAADGKSWLLGDPVFGLWSAAALGTVGAFFSRLVPFQSRLTQLKYDDILYLFSWRFIALRCAIGVLGAAVFFLFMRSKLIGGELFPNFEDSAKDGAVLMPVQEFAKVLVWSFIAGWSERLVPDTLTNTETSFKASFDSASPAPPKPAAEQTPALPAASQPPTSSAATQPSAAGVANRRGAT